MFMRSLGLEDVVCQMLEILLLINVLNLSNHCEQCDTFTFEKYRNI